MLHLIHPSGINYGQPIPSYGLYRGRATLRSQYRTIFASQSTTSDRGSTADFVAFTLIVDDLVFWDGTTRMGQLGGGGAQTAWGYQTYYSGARHVALAAGVGPDLPVACLEWFQRNNIDTNGIHVHMEVATPRAWQILEQDGRRHEVRKSVLFV